MKHINTQHKYTQTSLGNGGTLNKTNKNNNETTLIMRTDRESRDDTIRRNRIYIEQNKQQQQL